MSSLINVLKNYDQLENHYIIGDIIGRGQFSIIYKCLHKGKVERACRVYRKENLNHEKLVKQLEKVIKIKHKNIIRIFEGFENENEIQLVCERIRGEELFDRIVTLGFYSEVEAASVMRNILSALECLHQNGIIHGDIRPESLFYESEDENAQLKLRDVSFSKCAPNTHSTIFIAPEGIEPTMEGDIWSLGNVLYLMLYGLEPERQLDYELHEIDTQDDVTDAAKTFLKQMLTSKPNSRTTAISALNNNWVQGITTGENHMELAMERLKEFNAKRKFRAATKVVLAAQKMTNSRNEKRS